VSDGRSVFVWCGNGVAAAFDLDGRRRWIRRVAEGKLFYPSSPALIDGKLAVFMKALYCLDAETGEPVWKQPSIDKNNAAVQPARVAGTAVIVTQQGEVVRASDGHVLWKNPDKIEGDTGWNAPVVLGDVMYLPWYGTSEIRIIDFTGCGGDSWQAKVARIDGICLNRKPDGSWIDRWTPASPLIHDGIAYLVDIYATLYAVDLREKKVLYRQEIDLDGMFHYNAVPVAASPTLVGDRILVLDNQGTTLVLQPGREFRQVGKNRIATQIARDVPISPQETIAYAPPVPDGDQLYIRGERYLYSIGGER
jgi:outer membrane protein assembly factor BamB